jgi:hypothetical protein
MPTPSSPLLYSTNAFLKFFLMEKFRNGLHYVWCGDTFDSSKHGSYSIRGMNAPSSDPCSIYKILKSEIAQSERHSYKIKEQKASLQALALQWQADGSLTTEEAEEFTYIVKTAEMDLWRPLIYVIPRAIVEPRLKVVPIGSRASIANEFIVPDLRKEEFDVIEP